MAHLMQERKTVNTDTILKKLPAAEILCGGAFHKRNSGTDLKGFCMRELTPQSPLSTFRTFTAFDTETTGLGFNDDVIEIAAVRFVDFIPQMQFSALIRPRKPIPAAASAVNHITDDMVQDAPHFYELIPAVNAFFGDSVLVAHNAMFDVRMMYVNGLDSMREKSVYDTCDVSRRMDAAIANHKLATACRAHQITIGNAHRAASDAMACGLLFVDYLLRNYGAVSIDELKKKAGEGILC